MSTLHEWFATLSHSDQEIVLDCGKRVTTIAHNLKLSFESVEFNRLVAVEAQKHKDAERKLGELRSQHQADRDVYELNIKQIEAKHAQDIASIAKSHADDKTSIMNQITQVKADYDARIRVCQADHVDELQREQKAKMAYYAREITLCTEQAELERSALLSKHRTELENAERLHKSTLECEIATRENRIRCLEQSVSDAHRAYKVEIAQLKTLLSDARNDSASELTRVKNEFDAQQKILIQLSDLKCIITGNEQDTVGRTKQQYEILQQKINDLSAQLLKTKTSRTIGDDGESLVYDMLTDVYGMTEGFEISCTNKQVNQTDIQARIYGVKVMVEVKNRSNKTPHKEFVKFKTQFLSGDAVVGVFVTLRHGIDRFDGNELKEVGKGKYIFVFPAIPADDRELTRIHVQSWKLPLLMARGTAETIEQAGMSQIDRPAMFAAANRTVNKIQAIAEDSRKRKRECDANWASQVTDVEDLMQEVFTLAKIARVDDAVDVKMSGIKTIPRAKMKTVILYLIDAASSLGATIKASEIAPALNEWAEKMGLELVDPITIGKCMSNMQFISKLPGRPVSYSIRDLPALRRIAKNY